MSDHDVLVDADAYLVLPPAYPSRPPVTHRLVADLRAEVVASRAARDTAWREVDALRAEVDGLRTRLAAAEAGVIADPEALARMFHETYERLAPHYDYETRRESAVPWEDVPANNKALMTAVCAEIARVAADTPKEPDGV